MLPEVVADVAEAVALAFADRPEVKIDVWSDRPGTAIIQVSAGERWLREGVSVRLLAHVVGGASTIAAQLRRTWDAQHVA